MQGVSMSSHILVESEHYHYPVYALRGLRSFLSQKKGQLKNHNNMMKKHCKNAASWSWEMLGTLYVIAETFGGMRDNIKLCLRKVHLITRKYVRFQSHSKLVQKARVAQTNHQPLRTSIS